MKKSAPSKSVQPNRARVGDAAEVTARFSGTKQPHPASERDVELLTALSRSCRLEDIVFDDLEAKVFSRPGPDLAQFFFDNTLEVEACYSGTTLSVVLRLHVRSAGKKEAIAADELLFKLRLSLLILYAVPAGLEVSQEVLGAFAFVNASQAGWPYLRQATYDLAGRCGFPGLLLPVRRPNIPLLREKS